MIFGNLTKTRRGPAATRVVIESIFATLELSGRLEEGRQILSLSLSLPTPTQCSAPLGKTPGYIHRLYKLMEH